MDRQIDITIDPPAGGRHNMATDQRLLEQAEGLERFGTFVRFYSWSSPTVSLGRFQEAAQAIDLDYCRQKSIDFVSRPTGGRAVLHDNDLTYAIASNDSSIFPLENIHKTYLRIAWLLSRALESLGIPVTLQQRSLRPHGRRETVTPCFAAVARHEILCDGRKLVGSAQRRLRRSFLQHGSIPVELDYDLHGRVLRFDARELRLSITCIRESCQQDLTLPEIASVFANSFEHTLHFWSTSGGSLLADAGSGNIVRRVEKQGLNEC